MAADQLAEHWGPGAEQDGNDVHADLVDQPLRQVLIGQSGAAHDGDIGVTGGGSRLFEAGIGAVGDERVHTVGGNVVGGRCG